MSGTFSSTEGLTAVAPQELVFLNSVSPSPKALQVIDDTANSSGSSKYGCNVLLLITFVGLIVWISFLTAKLSEMKSVLTDPINNSPITTSIITTSPTVMPTMVPTVDPTIRFCDDEDYFKQIVKEEYTHSIAGIIKNENIDEYEASGVIYDPLRDVYWVVFDNMHSISKLTTDLTRNQDNILVSSPTKIKLNSDDDGYEGITRDPETDVFYLLTESVGFDDDNDDTVHFPIIRSVLYDEQFTFIQSQICIVDVVAPTGNKGLEGLDVITIDDAKYFVALCEGNYCSFSDEGKDSGNGRMLLISFESNNITMNHEYGYLMDQGINCMYNTINIFELPSYIDFEDYSDFQFRINSDSDVDNEYDAVIVSQASAAMWFGRVQWSLDAVNFDDDYDDEIYKFPMGSDCATVFCNVEGVTFVDDKEYEFVMVSDKVKGGGEQSWVCGHNDESIHIFKLP